MISGSFETASHASRILEAGLNRGCGVWYASLQLGVVGEIWGDLRCKRRRVLRGRCALEFSR